MTEFGVNGTFVEEYSHDPVGVEDCPEYLEKGSDDDHELEGGFEEEDVVIPSPVKDRDLVPEKPFPFDALGASLQELALKGGEALNVDPEMVATVMLVLVSAAIGNSTWITPKEGFNVPPFLWNMIIAPTGYGKTPAIKTFIEPFERRQAVTWRNFGKINAHKNETASQEFDMDKMEHCLVTDSTIEALATIFVSSPRGVLIHNDELAGLMTGLNQYKGKGNDLQHILQLFDASPWKVDRKSGGCFIPNTGAAIIGGIQPGLLPEIFRAESFVDGLLPRFLMLQAQEKPIRFSHTSIDNRMLGEWGEVIDYCYKLPLHHDNEGFVRPNLLKFSKEALELWVRFFDDYGRIEPLLSTRAKGFIPKLHTYSLKFACIVHVLDGIRTGHVSKPIEPKTVEHAIAVTEYFAGQAMGVINNVSSRREVNLDKLRQNLLKVLRRLKNKVRNSKLPLSAVRDLYNKEVPEVMKLDSNNKVLGGMLRKLLGLRTERGTNGGYCLVWDEEKLGGWAASEGDGGDLHYRHKVH